MELTDELVEQLALLARLSFSDEEKASIKHDLQRMIHFVEKLEELDVSRVEPLLHMAEHTPPLREDLVQGSVSREAALSVAPDTDGQFFRVPKVIRK